LFLTEQKSSSTHIQKFVVADEPSTRLMKSAAKEEIIYDITVTSTNSINSLLFKIALIPTNSDICWKYFQLYARQLDFSPLPPTSGLPYMSFFKAQHRKGLYGQSLTENCEDHVMEYFKGFWKFKSCQIFTKIIIQYLSRNLAS